MAGLIDILGPFNKEEKRPDPVRPEDIRRDLIQSYADRALRERRDPAEIIEERLKGVSPIRRMLTDALFDQH